MHSKQDTSPRLIVRSIGQSQLGEDDTWHFKPGKELVIGRALDADVKLQDKLISRRHATLSFNGKDWVCSRIGQNGIYQNGRPITQVVVKQGTVLQFVTAHMKLHFQVVANSNADNNCSQEDETVVGWVNDLASGETDAAGALWEQYYNKVVALARRRISDRQRCVSDEEDVAISVFRSICSGLEAGRFPDIKNHNSMWRLLCVMTRRKAARHYASEQRQRRGGGNVVRESSVGGSADGAFENLNAAEDFAFQLLDQADWLIHVLGDDELRVVAEMKLAAHTNQEIAAAMNCGLRTVERRLEAIRSILTHEIS